MKKVLTILILIISLGLLVSVGSVRAESPQAELTITSKSNSTGNGSATRDVNLQNKIEAVQKKTTELQAAREKVATKTAERCQEVGKRIDVALSNYQNNRTKQIQLYQSMSEKIQQILLKLQQNGVDVTTLQADLQQFNVKIQQLNSDAAASMAQLQVAKQYQCGTSQGQFVTELEKARTLMKTTEKDAQDIRTFFETTIKVDIQALRAKVQKSQLESNLKRSPKPSAAAATGSRQQ